ncbi:hypothetical protein Tco_0929229 [Tanacetum coccineum]
MMSDSSGGDLSDVDDFDDLEMIMQQVQAEQEEEEAERVRHRNYIYREHIEAEERLKADYFGPNPKYPLYYLSMQRNVEYPKALHYWVNSTRSENDI